MNDKNKPERLYSGSNNKHERFCDRLKFALGDKSVRSLAISSGMSPTVMTKYINGESTPNVERLVAIADALNASIEWLATGRSSKDYNQCSGCKEAPAQYNVDGIGDDYELVNLYNAEVSMGGGAWNENENIVNPLAFRRDWLTNEGLKASSCAAILARGDSMSPTIEDGATLLVDLKDNYISREGVYVIRFDGTLLAKRLQRSFDGSVIIKSDNERYDKIHVPADQVNNIDIVGRVAWYASTI